MIKMFQDDELDILYLQAKSFWSKFNFKKANLVVSICLAKNYDYDLFNVILI